jgi:hypothetical protein
MILDNLCELSLDELCLPTLDQLCDGYGPYPQPSDVRAAVVYGFAWSGTLAVPSPQSVAYNVATDNTVGTAVLTEADVVAALATWTAAALSGTLAAGSPGALWQNIGTPASGDTPATGLYATIGEIEGGNVGPGGIPTTIVIENTGNAVLGGVSCWITSDSAGATTIAGTLQTNSLGSVLFMLDAGVNYFWRHSLTYNFPNPVPITVEGSSMSVTFADATVIAGPASGYAARSDIEQIFGVPNIIKWAILSANDPDSPAGLAEITGRINWALKSSTVDFNNAMRQGGYTLPITGAEASIWATNVVATRAGLYLYQHLKPTQRGQDGHPIPDRYDGIFTWAEEQLNFVRSKKLRLDAAVFGKGTNAPFATHERSRGAYGPGIGGYGTGPFPPPGPFVG